MVLPPSLVRDNTFSLFSSIGTVMLAMFKQRGFDVHGLNYGIAKIYFFW